MTGQKGQKNRESQCRVAAPMENLSGGCAATPSGFVLWGGFQNGIDVISL
jgi:hypothetical protein